VESCVGAHLIGQTRTSDRALYYWREGDDEVDFVHAAGTRLTAIEVKSGAGV
jgi:predicted AAA+ superfamily ATPase